jgi:hypothetical protein
MLNLREFSIHSYLLRKNSNKINIKYIRDQVSGVRGGEKGIRPHRIGLLILVGCFEVLQLRIILGVEIE